MKNRKLTDFTLIVFAILISITIYGFTVDLSSRFGANLGKGLAIDGLAMIFWLAVFYILYEKLNLNFETYILLCSGMLLHLLGDLYLYGKNFWVIQFDMVTHTFLGFVLALVIFRILSKTYKPDKKSMFLMIVLAAMGLAAIHEIIEFLGYFFIGEGPGIFMYGVGDFGEYNDICFDLISNLIGAVLGIIYCKFRYRK